MAAERIVVGSTGDDAGARTLARRLRDAGHEIVFVGGSQSPEQLAAAAVAEDAVRVAVDADSSALQRVRDALDALGADDIVVEPWCDVSDAT
ncbi:MAG: cobalamin-dependent protein [Aeromicrobium sp.]